jgi:hypothetical protein
MVAQKNFTANDSKHLLLCPAADLNDFDFMEDKTLKYFYIAAQRKTDSGFYAYCIRVTNLDNIAERLRSFYAANVCTTKKQALEIAEAWNTGFIANGTHAFMNDRRQDLPDDEAALPF